RDATMMNRLHYEMQDLIRQTVFEQFVFFTQWHEIRVYAKQHGIELFGDMPIFVALDSADVWSKKQNFLINSDGEMEFISGVPPDAFSDKGQRWGNPLYNWQYMQSTKYEWWKQRLQTQLELFDMVRIDHFRGLQACWYIPEQDDTAINGEWVEVPGREMLTTLFANFDYLPLIAEDLGVITDDVIRLKHDFNMPGMKVLQFAFDGNNANPHLPHCHEPGDVIYTGTHDNDTLLGWLKTESSYNKKYLEEYINEHFVSVEERQLSMIRLAMASVSFLCIIPLQDLMMLDSESRMNVPGTTEGNWQWRFDWSLLRPDVLETVSHYMSLYQR
ncbi:MAG: 4-alpha-glucanotransferase, partial [Gammaproteobacteria bacterium]|nr:4-alpha-glucanotransferase [Gammaproteobacteria bacterium]